jgi:hypothetical protein
MIVKSVRIYIHCNIYVLSNSISVELVLKDIDIRIFTFYNHFIYLVSNTRKLCFCGNYNQILFLISCSVVGLSPIVCSKRLMAWMKNEMKMRSEMNRYLKTRQKAKAIYYGSFEKDEKYSV